MKWEQSDDVFTVLSRLEKDGYQICALEQTKDAVNLNEFMPTDKCAVLLGSEVTGITSELLKYCKTHLVIPMFGQKESFNVVQAAAMTLYQLRFR
jgi:tRNA G18 (ribose-2'-O)-methylase SpoU